MNARAALMAAAIALSGCGCRPPAPEAVIAAERAFAADGYARGIKASFLAHSADDAIMFAPGPVNAHATLKGSPDEDLTEPRRRLVWWPLYAGLARSGDLGFTTGPYAFDDDRRGHYFTIWRKEPDGGWKWILDAGVGADATNEAPKDSPVAYLPPAATTSSSPAEALAAVAQAELLIAEAARENVQSAYGPFLAGDSRLHSDGPPPSKSSADRGAQFAARPQAIEFRALGQGASAAGDFVWTYGEGRWRESGVDFVGWYVRVWQKRRAGWKIAFDEFIPPPPAQ